MVSAAPTPPCAPPASSSSRSPRVRWAAGCPTGSTPYLIGAYTAVAALALLASFEFALIPIGTLAFLGMAAALGTGSGAVFALVARLVPADQIGSVTGIVGAAGGLGGFFPPLVMGAVYGIADDYTWGYVLLALTAAATCAFTATVVRQHAMRRGVHGRNA